MRITLAELLNNKHIGADETVYGQDMDRIGGYVISAGDFFDVVDDPEERKLYEPMFKSSCSETAAEEFCITDEERLLKIRERIIQLKSKNRETSEQHQGEIVQLRTEQRRLKDKLEKPIEDAETGKLIRFKNNLTAVSFQALERVMPYLSNIQYPGRNEMPLFTKRIPELAKAAETGRPVGISGGPCLFGVNEVMVVITELDGRSTVYDFSSGRNSFLNGEEADLGEVLERYAKKIRSIDFINHKKGVTSQEYDSILYLFEYARAFHAKLVIPLPDMSYIKYFYNITKVLPESAARPAREKFEKIAYQISDLYLNVISRMKCRYPDVEYVAVHQREEALCRLYYEKRQSYLTDSMVKRLTSVRGKTGAVLDYITMPALPYYIWGIRDVIQIDCLDEADSYRKCAKLHKRDMNLYALMYPERISADGENTIFYAPLEYKEYLTFENPEGERQN